MPTSGVEQDAARLLGAFYDLSGHDPLVPVQVGSPGTPAERSAAGRAGLEPGSHECDVALRYLLNKDHLRAAQNQGEYTITVMGIEEVRRRRGLENPTTAERSGMSDRTQRLLLTGLTIAISAAVSKPVANYFARMIPERRGIRDDLTEAAVQGLVRLIAVFIASVVVRKLAGGR